MRARPILICSIEKGFLRGVRFCAAARPLVTVCAQGLPAGASDEAVAQALKRMLAQLGWRQGQVILSLPRSQAACRPLKLPTLNAQEIEKMVALQATNVLPFVAEELVTAYSIVDSDIQGYTHLNAVVVQRQTVEHLLAIMRQLGIRPTSIVLSSQGLAQLLACFRLQEAGPAAVIEIDPAQAELCIVAYGRMVASRHILLPGDGTADPAAFAAEVTRTIDFCAKETDSRPPQKALLVGPAGMLSDYAKVLTQQAHILTETLPLQERVNFSVAGDGALAATRSFAHLVGLAMQALPATLNLMPEKADRRFQQARQARQGLQAVIYASAALLFFFLAAHRAVENKGRRLALLEKQLQLVSQEARPVEALFSRAQLLTRIRRDGKESLEIIAELHRLLPVQARLASLDYEETGQLTLRGEAKDLGFVLLFIGELERSAMFSGYRVRLRYATQKKTASREAIDFEIVCSKEV